MSEIIDEILILISIWFLPISLIFGGNVMNNELLVGLIGAGVTVLVFVLKWILYDRKQYKHVLKMMGDFKGASLENTLGVPDKGKNLTLQHDEIKKILNQDIKDILNQDIKSVLKNDIQAKIDFIEKETYINKENRGLLNKEQQNIHQTVSALLDNWAQLNSNYQRLLVEFNQQEIKLNSLQEYNTKLERKISELQSNRHLGR